MKLLGKEHVATNSLPIQFEQVVNVLDDRFMRVKVWIAHTGENRNACIFSKEVLESMIPSLANIPILGYIAVNEDDEIDFAGHEERLVVEDGKFKLKYFGRAYGMIPAEHNAHFETRYGEDGVEREYLVCDGLIWRKFPEVEEIFDRDSGYKSQSMELQHSSVEGYKNDEGLFVFTNAKFEGACLLGENVTPAMVSSTIERFSVTDSIQNDLSEMLTEFNTYFSTTEEKGDETVPTENEILETEKTETEFTTNEETVEETQVVEETPAVEPSQEEAPANFEEQPADEAPVVDETPAEPVSEEPPAEFAKDDEEEEEEDKDSDKEDDEEEEDKPKKFTRTFELSHDDIRTGLYQSLEQHEAFSNSWIWVSKVFDSHAVVEDESNGKFFKVNYVKHESAVEIGEFEEIFPMWVNGAEKSALEIARTNFQALTDEVKELREFKSTIELDKKEQKLSQYSSTLSKEEMDSIKSNLVNFSMEDIEKEIGFMLLKKNHFSAKTDEVATETRVASTNAVETNPYGSASVYFSK